MSDAIRPSIGGADRVKPPTTHRAGNDARRAPGSAFLDMLGGDDAPSQPDQRQPVTSAPEALPRQRPPRAPDVPGAPDGDARFNVPLAKSDHAVAFDARGVVGATSVAMPMVEIPQIQCTATEQPSVRRLDLLRDQLWGGPAQVEISTLVPESSTAAVTPHVAGLQKTPSGARPTQAMATDARPQPTAVADRLEVSETMAPEQFPDLDLGPVEASGRSRQAIEHQQARGNLLARMIASDQDYRLLLRGSALEPPQVRSIKRAIRNLLRAFGLPDMPVLISWHRKGK